MAKREEILKVALEIVAQAGYRNATVRQLADAVGLSTTGLLHYFGSKENLFTEIVRRRDKIDIDAADDAAARAPDRHGELIHDLPDRVRRSADVPGQVELYARLAAEAIDRHHPSHVYFENRYAWVRSRFAASLRTEQEAGRLPVDVDADRLAGILLAIVDGVQLQWLYDPSFDMAEHLRYALALIGFGDAADGMCENASLDDPARRP
ncbi:TetR/AcrR family transcriptional regulator [Streptomyces fuscichromogenes]|uniref:TetR/AcrR family transcriptional regulator n=1 Tax=Streptomyces fuscichromogenes TaxID=1324013 RepID=UPI001E4F4F61|nr:TetR/AcrR family transcriptional regulator [Streptomyces fuscichromogenes]